MSDMLPSGLDPARHRDLVGRRRQPVVRRLVLALFAVVAGAALLNSFGQQPVTTAAQADAASLTVQAPKAVRGGLLFEARIEVRAHRRLEQPRIVLARGWVEGLQINTMVPAAVREASPDGRLHLEFDPLDAGRSLSFQMQFQVDPASMGSRDQTVTLQDGVAVLASAPRTIRVYP